MQLPIKKESASGLVFPKKSGTLALLGRETQIR